MTPAVLIDRITEADAVRRWRLEELRRGGYSLVDALVLSGRRDVDLHAAVKLLRNGCPPGTALRILL